jgi:hypothetical protein
MDIRRDNSAKLKEEQDRANLKKQNEEEALRFAKFYSDRQGINARWKRVGEVVPTEAPHLSFSNDIKKVEHGVHKRDGAPCTVNYTEKGVAPSVTYPSLSFKRGVRKYYGECMDFIAGALGSKVVHIDFPKKVKVKQLEQLMELAEERGLRVELSPKIKEFLGRMKSGDISLIKDGVSYNEKDYNRIMGKLQKINENSLNKLTGFDIQSGYARSKSNHVDETKLPASQADRDAVLDKLMKKNDGTPKSEDEQRQAIKDELTRLATRATKLEKDKTDLDAHLSNVEGMDITNREVLDQALRQTTPGIADARTDLLKSMTHERDDIAARIAMLDAKLNQIPTTSPQAPTEKQAIQQQSAGVTAKLAQVDDPALQSIRTRSAAVTAKVDAQAAQSNVRRQP